MSKKFNRYTITLVSLMLVVGLLAACAPKATTEPTAAPTAAPTEEVVATPEPTKEPVTINLWVIDRVGADAMETVKTVAEQWAAETGNTVVVTEGNQFEMLNNIPVAIPAGEGPDIFLNINNYIGGHYAAELIIPLEEYLDETEKANYLQNALDSFTLDGHLLGIPFAADTCALVYNKALVPTAPSTMNELIAMAKPLTSGDQYGFLYQIDSFWYSYPFMAAYGGYVFKWTGTGYDVADLGFSNAGAIEGLTYLKSLVDEGLMPADATADVMNSLFTEGKIGMIITNPTMVPSFEAAGIDIGIAPIPTTPNGESPRPFATYSGFSVSSQSENPDVAADLAVYMGKNLPLPLYKTNHGNIPVYTPVAENEELKSDEQLAGWVKQLAVSEVLPSINEMNFVWGPATTAFMTIVHGDEDPTTALTSAQELILQAIAENQ